jgi:hypothetical protein
VISPVRVIEMLLDAAQYEASGRLEENAQTPAPFAALESDVQT